jgi:hypothetical protein
MLHYCRSLHLRLEVRRIGCFSFPNSGDRMKIRRPIMAMLACLLSLAWVATATAQDRTFWRYDRGYFENTGGKDWTRKHDNRTIHYVEEQRNAKFVVLHPEDNRDVTGLLFDDSVYFKGRDGVWKKHHDGTWVNVAKVSERNYWKHGKGHFENTTGNTWVEKIDDKTFRFVEVERTDKRIELYDKGRDYTIHLYATDCWGKPGGEAWKKLYTGKWGK